jgi:hypothetical protein
VDLRPPDAEDLAHLGGGDHRALDGRQAGLQPVGGRLGPDQDLGGLWGN